MRIQDLHLLPKMRDSWSYLYVEHCRIDQDQKAIAIHDADGKTPVPCALLALLMLGPGTSITHAAVRSLADNGCLVMWCGEESVRFYAIGQGETRSSERLLQQARLWADPVTHLQVVFRMYRMRFHEPVDERLGLEELRGREGVRVRTAYGTASRETGIEWRGRAYNRNDWRTADPINRALSAANSCLYGLCHAAIISAGLSPALGFIHTGKMLSFVYDIADLYKTEVSIPVAFRTLAQAEGMVEARVRQACRDAFREARLLDRLVPDLDRVLALDRIPPARETADFDADEAAPGSLWDGKDGEVQGGVNRGPDPAAGDESW